jgi:Uma2 family endonuclease
VSSIPNHIVLYDIPWGAYTKMIDALGDKHVPHVYQKGTLEMMSPAKEHERIKKILARLIEAAAIELKVPLACDGSATRRDRKLEHGLEPDESYYVGHESVERAESPDAKDVVPDLAIEIAWSRPVLTKLDSYAVIGVREVWRYQRGKVEFFVLGEDGKYSSVERSLAFPLFTTKLINQSVKQRLEEGETKAIEAFLGKIRKLRKKS